MDYGLLENMKVKELNNYWKIRGLKVTRIKNELIVRVFATSENGVQPVKAAVELKLDLITDYQNERKVHDFPIPEPFKKLHGWIEED